MAEGTGGNRWVAASQTVEEEMQTWQQAHPVATLTEIELAVEAVTAKLQARQITDLAQDMREVVTAAEQPDCPHCGAFLGEVWGVSRRVMKRDAPSAMLQGSEAKQQTQRGASPWRAGRQCTLWSSGRQRWGSSCPRCIGPRQRCWRPGAWGWWWHTPARSRRWVGAGGVVGQQAQHRTPAPAGVR